MVNATEQGHNAVLACPSTVAATKTAQLGIIGATFSAVSELPSGDGHPTAAEKLVKYFLTADDDTAGFKQYDIVEWDSDLSAWKLFEGIVTV